MEEVLDIYKKPYDAQCPQVCLDEMSTQLIGEVRAPLPAELGRLNWRPIFDRILDLVAHHRCLGG